MERLTKYLFVISFDGLGALDFEFINTLPNFREFIKSSAFCKNVYTIYPSLTYPAHATIVTGRYPKNHGVINNTLLQPRRKSPDWYWKRKYVKGETLYDLAIDRGMKVSSILWPVTAKSRIHYNMPEIFANRVYQNQILVSFLNGSPIYQMEMNKKYGHLRKGLKQPNLDNFTHGVFLETIRRKKADLNFVHYTDLDSMRHGFGFSSREATEALIRHDKRLGEIVRIIKENGIYEDSTIVVLGDHSSLDEDKIICLNVLFRENGYIDVDSKGRITNYKVILKSCDGSSYVYVRDNSLIHEVKDLLDGFNSKYNCVESILTGKEAGKLGADVNCSFMLEGRVGYYFSDALGEKVIKNIKLGESGQALLGTRATHGYSPLKNKYKTVFIAAGKGIKIGAKVDKMSLIDEGPTLGRLLGIDLKEADGNVIEEFIDEKYPL